MPYEFERVAIEDGFDEAGIEPNSDQAKAARLLEPVRKIAVAIDHVDRRARDSIRLYGYIDPDDLTAIQGDLAFAEANAEILHVALETSLAMIGLVKSQLAKNPPKPDAVAKPVAPTPDPFSNTNGAPGIIGGTASRPIDIPTAGIPEVIVNATPIPSIPTIPSA